MPKFDVIKTAKIGGLFLMIADDAFDSVVFEAEVTKLSELYEFKVENLDKLLEELNLVAIQK